MSTKWPKIHSSLIIHAITLYNELARIYLNRNMYVPTTSKAAPEKLKRSNTFAVVPNNLITNVTPFN